MEFLSALQKVQLRFDGGGLMARGASCWVCPMDVGWEGCPQQEGELRNWGSHWGL